MSLIERIENKQIIEGIDFDTEKSTVSYNPNHEENIDTSIEKLPKTNTMLGAIIGNSKKQWRHSDILCIFAAPNHSNKGIIPKLMPYFNKTPRRAALIMEGLLIMLYPASAIKRRNNVVLKYERQYV